MNTTTTTDDALLKLAVSRAAIKWCGEKDRETFLEDIKYFECNWRWADGLRRYVDDALAHLKETHSHDQ